MSSWRLAFSQLFSAAFDRHLARHRNADYEVYRDWLCRLMWFVERWVWYEGG